MPEVIDWLLEEDNPPVRTMTLTGLLGEPPGGAKARKARASLMDYGPTRRILAQADEFLTNDDESAYDKYTGFYWQAIFLGWFLADGKEPRIARLCDRLMERRAWVRKTGIQCLTANLLAALTRLGYGDRPAVREEREALAARIVRDGGIDCRGMDYSLLPRCQMAQPKLLLCFTQIPPTERSKTERAAVDLMVRRIMDTEVFIYQPEHRKEWAEIIAQKPGKDERGPGATVTAWITERKKKFLSEKGPGGREPKAGWMKFGFPLHYNSDILEALYALALAGAKPDSRLDKALEAVRAKRNKDGVWIMENTLNGKMRADVEVKGKPSKWLTYFALSVLRLFGA
jgi:hypothetical protein